MIPWKPQGPDGWIRLRVGMWSPTCLRLAPTQAPLPMGGPSVQMVQGVELPRLQLIMSLFLLYCF